MNLLKLNIRGTVFLFDTACVQDKLDPDSPLLDLTENSKYFLPERDEFYFNRNAAVFDHVMEYLASGRLHIPGNVCTVIVQGDLQFWGVPTSRVDHCCWKAFYQTDEDVDIIQKLLAYIPSKAEESCTTSSLPVIEGPRLDNADENGHSYSTLTDFIRRLYDRKTLPGKGYVIGIVCVMCGILLIALPIAVTSSNFSSFYEFLKCKGRHEELQRKNVNRSEVAKGTL